MPHVTAYRTLGTVLLTQVLVGGTKATVAFVNNPSRANLENIDDALNTLTEEESRRRADREKLASSISASPEYAEAQRILDTLQPPSTENQPLKSRAVPELSGVAEQQVPTESPEAVQQPQAAVAAKGTRITASGVPGFILPRLVIVSVRRRWQNASRVSSRQRKSLFALIEWLMLLIPLVAGRSRDDLHRT
jgi:hypothetical protein